jgi:hypothetical protein
MTQHPYGPQIDPNAGSRAAATAGIWVLVALVLVLVIVVLGCLGFCAWAVIINPSGT